MISALRIELRRSPLRWCLPLLGAVDLAVLLLRSRTWVGVWPEASAAAQLPTLYLGLALAGAAAWISGRTARAEADELLLQMARPAWQRETVTLAATWLYGVVAYAIGIVVAAAMSVRSAGPGFLWPSYLLLGLSMITLAASVGHLVGRLLPGRYIAPLIALPVIFLNVAVRVGPDHMFYVLSGAVQLSVSAAGVVSRLAVAVAVAAVAVTLVPVSERHEAKRTPRRYMPGAAAVIATLAAVMAVFVVGPLRDTRPAPSHPLCSTVKPQVCVWPEDVKYLPSAAAMAVRLGSLPAGLFEVPGTFYEAGLRSPERGPTDFNTTFDTWSVAQNMAFSIHITGVDSTKCTVADSDQQRYFTAVFELDQWLSEHALGGPEPSAIHGGPPDLDRDAIHAVETQPEEQQISWAAQRVATVRSLCV